MFKMSHSSKNHSYTILVRSVNRVLVFHRTTRLDNGCNSGIMSSFHTVRKREKSIRRHYTSCDTVASLTNSVFKCPDPADLSWTNSCRTKVFGYCNTVGFGMFYYFPRKYQIPHFSFRRLAFGDYF